MKTVVIVIAAFVTLGAAAVGMVASQNGTLPSLPGATATVTDLAKPDQSKTATPATPVRTADAPTTTVSAAPSAASVAPAAGAAPARPAQESSGGTPAATTPVPAPASAAPATSATPARMAQNTNGPALAAAAPPAAVASAPPPVTAIAACDKPGGMGLTRVVEIDTTGGPGFGFEHFKQYDFLRDKEVVLTFDDGPWPENTPAVLKALADNCLKATFFEIGEHAMWHPEIAKQVAAAGNTIGSHTWSHKDLSKKPYADDIDLAKQEIEMGVSAVHAAVAGPIAPFFRFPALQHPPELLSYLAERNIASFSADFDSLDFKIRKPEQVIHSVMTKLEKYGKGIILMHDFQKATAEAMPDLLRQLKAGGYKVVHLVPHAPVTTIAKYDEMVVQQDKLSVNNTRPQGSVFHTIGEYVGSPAPTSANGN
jgi:peptidoglycan/xylan/chitin deacetylase (PgdA/CDA1 family)